MNFANLKSLTIPEGKVVKISNANGTLWSAGRIPSEYQEIESIYMPSNAYINTGWIPSDGALFNIKFKPYSGGAYIFGCGSNPRLAISFSADITHVYNTSNSVSGIHEYNNLPTGVLYEVETYTSSNTDSYVKINNEIKANNETQNTNFNASLPMLIGAWYYGTNSIRHSTTLIYYAKAKIGETAIFELIPCYRKSDGVIGMYDTVKKLFFTNAGSGGFMNGTDI